MFDSTHNKSFWALLVSNSVPIFGVLFFRWSLFAIVYLYWLENVVVGLFNVVRMVKAEASIPEEQNRLRFDGKPYNPSMKRSVIGFFIVHYGLFTVVHGMFVNLLFGPADITTIAVWTGFLSFFLSHFISYRTNFIGQEEYKRVSAPELFFQPYRRVVILHIVVLVGGLFVKIIGMPIIALVLLALLKTAADVWSHTHEHEKWRSASVVS